MAVSSLGKRRSHIASGKFLIEEAAAVAAGILAIPWYLYVKYVARRPGTIVARCEKHGPYNVDEFDDVYCATCGEDLTE